jgi:hypothetical protein
MKGYEAVDDVYGTIYVPRGKDSPSADVEKKEKLDYTVLRKVLNEDEYVHDVGAVISLHDFTSDVTFVEVNGGDVQLRLDERVDHNRTWKLVIIGLQSTNIVIPDFAYVAGGVLGRPNILQVGANETQIISVVCSRDDSKTNYSIEIMGSIDGARDADVEIRIGELYDQLKEKLDTIDAEFLKVYDAIKDEKETAISWED